MKQHEGISKHHIARKKPIQKRTYCAILIYKVKKIAKTNLCCFVIALGGGSS